MLARRRLTSSVLSHLTAVIALRQTHASSSSNLLLLIIIKSRHQRTEGKKRWHDFLFLSLSLFLFNISSLSDSMLGNSSSDKDKSSMMQRVFSPFRYNWSLHMVADAEIIDSSVYCFHVDPCCSSSNITIRFEHIRRSRSEEMVPFVNRKKTEYHHSDDVSRYRPVHSQSQVAPDRLRIYCPAL